LYFSSTSTAAIEFFVLLLGFHYYNIILLDIVATDSFEHTEFSTLKTDPKTSLRNSFFLLITCWLGGFSFYHFTLLTVDLHLSEFFNDFELRSSFLFIVVSSSN